MYHGVIQSCIEHSLLIFCSTLYHYTTEFFVPLIACLIQYFGKMLSVLFFFKIQASVFYAYKRNTHSHFYLFSFFGIESKPCAYVITCNVSAVFSVQLILALIRIPLGFYSRHGALLLPISCCLRSLAYTHHEVNREYSLRVITECTQQFHTFHFTVAYATHIRTRFVCQAFT